MSKIWFSRICRAVVAVSCGIEDYAVTAWISRDADGPKAAAVFPPSIQAQPETTKIRDGTDFLCRVSGLVDQNGTISVHFRVKGETVQAHPARSVHDDRVFYFGPVKLAYAAVADVQLRVHLHEHFSTLR